MAPISMTLSDLDCHCSRLQTFLTPIHQWIWHVLLTLCVCMDGKVSMVFNRNCFDRLFDVRHPTGSHIHPKSGSIKEMAWDRQLLLHTTNRKYYMAYLFVPSPMTLDDLEGHSPNAGLIKCNSKNICATFSMVLTFTARRAVFRR